MRVSGGKSGGNNNPNGLGAQDKFTPENRALFLTTLAEAGSVAEAYRAVGIAKQTAYNWRAAHEDFAAEWDTVKATLAADSIEDEIIRRGIRGVDEPVIFKGQLAGCWVDKDGKEVAPGSEEAAAFKPLTIRKYSDTCLMALANANIPHKYRLRHEHSGPNGGAIPVEDKTDPLVVARRVAFVLAQGVQAAKALPQQQSSEGVPA